MKKAILSGILAGVILLTACSSGVDKDGLKPVNLEGIESGGMIGTVDRRYYNTLQHLLEPADWGGSGLEDYSADLVVIGEFVGDTHAYFRHSDDGFVFMADAFNELQILEVLYGDAKVGDILPIVQHYAVDEERNMFMSFDGATPMNKGDRWIYFLGYYDGAYTSAGLTDGRYPLPTKDMVRVVETFVDEVRAYRGDDEGFHENWDLAREKAVASLDASLLGVLESRDFRIELYAEILEHFQIKARDWTNPGKNIDARLIELANEVVVDS